MQHLGYWNQLDKLTLIFLYKVQKRAKIRNRYNQVQLSSQTQFAKIKNKEVMVENQCVKHKKNEFRIKLIYFFSLNTAKPSFEYYQQVYFVYSGLQDESLQVTISKLP